MLPPPAEDGSAEPVSTGPLRIENVVSEREQDAATPKAFPESGEDGVARQRYVIFCHCNEAIVRDVFFRAILAGSV